MSVRIGNLINIGSSSKGNAFFVELKRDGYEKPFGLLLDCGFEYEKIASRLRQYGKSINDIDAILITHEHTDHCLGAKAMVDKSKKVYAPETVFKRLGLSVEDRYIIRDREIKGVADGITVTPIPLDHMELNGSYVENYAYIIDVNNDFKLLYITDTQFVRYNLRPYPSDVIIVEANFDIVMMKYTIEGAVGFEKQHFERVLKSHMSVQHTAQWLAHMDLRNTKQIILMHLTTNKKNANPSRFKKIVEERLKKEGKTYIPPIKVAKEEGGFE